MALQWDDSLLVGIDEVDEQHRSLVETFTRLSAAAQNGEARHLIAELADFLVKYTHEHFATEERLMRQYGYPLLEEHLREHDEFTRDARELAHKITVEGASREIAIVTIGKLARWIINHIRKEDLKMGEHIRARIAESASPPCG